MKNLFKNLLILTLFSCNATPSTQSNEDVVLILKTEEPTNVLSASKVDTEISFDKYCNARYSYCIDYPKAVIFPQPESQNGDGRVFKNKKAEEVLRVFGRNNSDPDFGHISLEQQYNDDLQGVDEENGNNDRVITYQKLGKTFFVISGYNKGKIFYQKTILKDGAFAYAILQYDENYKVTFDKVSERIFKSFK